MAELFMYNVEFCMYIAGLLTYTTEYLCIPEYFMYTVEFSLYTAELLINIQGVPGGKNLIRESVP